ncbi:uncharacterized protein METZ01_LOCUS453484 [marine metagenome]|uniref:Uncharacterized protein n=1 Tax=marine metagenome TaxID=408172 RepID=A0A382ZZA9_9ZZZZ
MKKLFLLAVIIIFAIFIDGTLTHDIFDYRLDSFQKWATIILILGIFMSIAWPKTTKDKENKNNLK